MDPTLKHNYPAGYCVEMIENQNDLHRCDLHTQVNWNFKIALFSK